MLEEIATCEKVFDVSKTNKVSLKIIDFKNLPFLLFNYLNQQYVMY